MRQTVFEVHSIGERDAIPVELLEVGDIAVIRAYGPGGEPWGGEQDRWDGSRWVCEGIMGAPGPRGPSAYPDGYPGPAGCYGDPELVKYKTAIERQGEFGWLFLDYSGCPRGTMGRMGPAGGEEISHEELLIREVLSQPEIVDVDGGRWIPVNADALHELVEAFRATAK